MNIIEACAILELTQWLSNSFSSEEIEDINETILKKNGRHIYSSITARRIVRDIEVSKKDKQITFFFACKSGNRLNRS